MIFLDTTRTGATRHHSGLNRVGVRLREALGEVSCPVTWDSSARQLRTPHGITPGAGDWFLTPELFSEAERPGFADFLAGRSLRLAAIFHDAIPLRHPAITWPRSVARHPEYMKRLAGFDRIWAVSRESRDDLLGLWRWQGVRQAPPVDVLALGADATGSPRVSQRAVPAAPRILCLGIIEPRKDQLTLLEACRQLRAEGVAVELDLVGRVNPHFGAPTVARIRELQRASRGWLRLHEGADDATVERLFAAARLTAFPTRAEGCGLPLLESLWRGVPCVCSDLPVLRENAEGGGCLPVTPGDPAAWRSALRGVLLDDSLATRLTAEAVTRTLPTWREAAAALATALA
jgi:glycosyltransferase involved in cell wall biosynthesis